MNKPAEPALDPRDHPIAWLFTDALGLFHPNRKYSGFILLLCDVDALASRRDPGRGKSQKRFNAFLKEKLPAHTSVTNFNIQVPGKRTMFRLDEVLYEFIRNPMTHEGAHLDFESSRGCEVALSWSTAAASVKIDDERQQVFLGGDWIFNKVAGVVRDAMLEDLIMLSSGRG